MRLPKSRKQKILWYLILPFISCFVIGIILFQIGFVNDIFGIIALIIILPLWIGLLGMGADELVQKTTKNKTFFPIGKPSFIGIISVILPIIALVIIVIKIIMPDFFKTITTRSMISDIVSSLITISIILGLISVLGKHKDKYGFFGIILAILTLLFNSIQGIFTQI